MKIFSARCLTPNQEKWFEHERQIGFLHHTICFLGMSLATMTTGKPEKITIVTSSLVDSYAQNLGSGV
jgi:hypothetical protein